jgi:hypothetical protein
MSVNRHLPHVLVLPEDDANRQLANGFHLELASPRQFQVLLPAGGWMRVLECFNADHVSDMERLPNRLMMLLIDFDGRVGRLEESKAHIPNHLVDRVFILGVWSEPEALKADLGPYETAGGLMARDCRERTCTVWGHRLLQHNAGEIERLQNRVGPVLF